LNTSDIAYNLSRAEEMIQEALQRSREPNRQVRIMAVTKTHSAEVVKLALKAGVKLIGENRVSEGGRKVRELGRESGEFHMIGPLHTKEVRQAVRDFHWIDALDRMKIAAEVARRTVQKGKPQPGLLLEVNTSGEGSKHGFPPDEILLTDVLGEIGEMGLAVSGLLTVGPLGGTERDVAGAFARLRELRDELIDQHDHDLAELSMGMSDDFPVAVREGATLVRLGRFLFGPRRTG